MLGTENPELDDHLVDIIRMSSCGEHRMGSQKRAEFLLEILERGKDVFNYLIRIMLLPIVSNLLARKFIEMFLFRGVLQQLERVRKSTLVSYCFYLAKPGFLRTRGK